MNSTLRLALLATFAASSAVQAQSVIRMVTQDGDAAWGFPGSMITLGYMGQPDAYGLPQSAIDGSTFFRAQLRAVASNGNTSTDGWWVTREDSYQVVAHNGAVFANPLVFVNSAQYGRMYANGANNRVLYDYSHNRLLAWRFQTWTPAAGQGVQSYVNNIAWSFADIAPMSILAPTPTMLVFSATLPQFPNSLVAGPTAGLVAGWDNHFSTLIQTGQSIPEMPAAFYSVPDLEGSTQNSALGFAMRMNSSGHWVARVGIAGAGAGTHTKAVCRGTVNGIPQILLRSNDPAPGWPENAHATLLAFSRPSINASGHIAFMARVQTLTPAASNNVALYADRGNGLVLIARTGDPIVSSSSGLPAAVIGGVYLQYDQIPAPVISSAGGVAFVSGTSVGESVLYQNDFQVIEVSRRGMTIPHTNGRMTLGQLYNTFDPNGVTGLTTTSNGDLLFEAPVLQGYDPRIGSNPGPALFSWRPERGVRLVMGSGQLVQAAPSMQSKVVTVEILSGGNNEDGVPTGAGAPGSAVILASTGRDIFNLTPNSFLVASVSLNAYSCGIADIAGVGASVGADGILDNNDFILFIDRFFAGDERADFGRAGGVPGLDWVLDNNDFAVFTNMFFTGCD